MAEKKTGRRGPRAIPVALPKGGEVRIYAGARIADALKEITDEMPLYHGVKLLQVIEAAYEQGRVDGRREVFERVETDLTSLRGMPELKNRNPGRPRVKKPAKRKPAKRGVAARRLKKASKKPRI